MVVLLDALIVIIQNAKERAGDRPLKEKLSRHLENPWRRCAHDLTEGKAADVPVDRRRAVKL